MLPETMPRPVTVKWALALFWLAIVLGCIKLARTLSLPTGPGGYSLTVFSFIAIYAVMAMVVIYIAMGASWARGIMLILLLVGILPAVPLVLAHFSLMPFLGTLTCVQAVAAVTGIYLVFRDPAASWFSGSRRS